MASRTNPNVTATFLRTQADIASLADWIESELDKFDNDDQVTWGSVGTLEHVRANLIETLSYFSGVSEPEIQRSLDELRM